ncbi:conserved hypothetical protein [Aspergillus terreus NIH2624]|uniref:DUF7703 domain-containing protein n=1 Tax=Aspergillus terreus (strain NIH 2624 / FGSC A1156) TaxID=341663 RepID=Q0CAU8_ASPTN|nr:uncharacterized protein ATEG_09186 [Aspergillus terreus NIH2624]EAU30323.1 conserved hypothetical protein [Aspergillus terreus NIH2624]
MANDNALDGIVGAYHGDNFHVKVVFTTFLGIAMYNAIELIVLIFMTFKRYRGLYFWSLLLSAVLGILPQSISFLLKYYNFAPALALVLLSRLNLVIQNPRVHRRVLAMIIVDAILLHIPTTVLTYGSNFAPSGRARWVSAYTVMERIQLTGFCLQEFVLSGLYILETVKILRVSPPSSAGGRHAHINRKIMYQLLGINLLIIALDVILLVVEYLNFFVIQTTLKSLVYSIKLKLEFGVLGRLVFLVRSHRFDSSPRRNGAAKLPDFVDPAFMLNDYTHAPRPAGRVVHPWEDTECKTFVSHIESTAPPLPAHRR